MPTGRVLIAVGLLMTAAGLYISLGGRLPPLGRLPGDLRFERHGFTFYLPLTTSFLISVVLTLLLWLWRK